MKKFFSFLGLFIGFMFVFHGLPWLVHNAVVAHAEHIYEEKLESEHCDDPIYLCEVELRNEVRRFFVGRDNVNFSTGDPDERETMLRNAEQLATEYRSDTWNGLPVAIDGSGYVVETDASGESFVREFYLLVLDDGDITVGLNPLVRVPIMT